MLSSKPLPEMTQDEALDTLARLYKNYADRKVNEGRIRVEIERMEDATDIESILVDIGQALQQAESGTNYGTDRAATQELQANTGMKELEAKKLYFDDNPKTGMTADSFINNTHQFKTIADDMVAKAMIARAMLEADIRAFRRACNVEAYKEIAEPLMSSLFGEGVQEPRIQIAPVQTEKPAVEM